MSYEDEPGNLLDELAAEAPIERMRARFEELIAESPRESGRKTVWLACAAAALIAIAGALVVRLQSPATFEPSSATQTVLRMLQAPAAFERLRGINAAAELPASWPSLRPALLELLERDESVNVRLAALDVLLAPDLSAPAPDRLLEAFAAQKTAIVQAHLGHQLRRRGFLSRAELERILERPTIHHEARNVLTRLEES